MEETEQIKSAIQQLSEMLDGRLRHMESTLIQMEGKLKAMEGYEDLKMKVNTMETKFNIIWIGLGILGAILLTAVGGALFGGL